MPFHLNLDSFSNVRIYAFDPEISFGLSLSDDIEEILSLGCDVAIGLGVTFKSRATKATAGQ